MAGCAAAHDKAAQRAMLEAQHTETMPYRQLTWMTACMLIGAFCIAGVALHGPEEAVPQELDVAAPSLEVRRDGSIVAEIPQVCARLVVWYGANPPPKEDMWVVMTTDARGDRILDTPEEVIAYFQTLPRERRSAGIFITQDYTHLRHPDLLPPWVSEHMLRLMADTQWMEARRRQVQALAAACQAAGIPLWVNTDLGGGGQGGSSVRFERL